MLFYVFFEATLIPMYIIIGGWGGPNKIYAAFKFFLYTLLGSLLMLVALIYLYNEAGGKPRKQSKQSKQHEKRKSMGSIAVAIAIANKTLLL